MNSPKRVRTEAQLRALAPASQQARLRAAEALHEKRAHPELSLNEAARRHETTATNVKAYFGYLLHQNRSRGRVTVAQGDREPFLMNIVDARGRMVERVVRGSAARQRNLAHHHALARFAGPDGGDPELLAPFRRRRIAGVDLLTDPDQVERLFDAGELDFLEYQSF